METKKIVLVAMSGGVDSTYALIKLLADGFNVIGVTFKLYESNCFKKNIDLAETITKKYNVKHMVVDYTKNFKAEIIEYFIDTYKRGNTPNPCVMCNKKIKFGLFNDLRKELKADYIATGHYANIEKIDDKYHLKKAIDKKKDQSYFLNQIPKDILKYCIFPLGNVKSKEYVRKFLADKKIEISTKKDSQEICFITDNDTAKYIKEYIPEKEGIIKDINGNIQGKHIGITYYTIGQRRGLGISSKVPLYINKINANENELIVGSENLLYSNTAKIKNINILAPELLDKALTCKIRYSCRVIEVKKIINYGSYYEVIFKKEQKSITPRSIFSTLL